MTAAYDRLSQAPNRDRSASDNSALKTPQKVLLVVSFGTSYDNNRDLSIGSIERALESAFPHYEIRRAFTGQTVINILARRNIEIDNVAEAMDRLIKDGVREVLVQPTHVMRGFEYDDTVGQMQAYSTSFDTFGFGKPLLSSDDDFNKVASIIVEETEKLNTDDTALVFVGHGSEHRANSTYTRLQKILTANGHVNYFVGTVEASPNFEDVLQSIKAIGAHKAIVLPLMIVAGDHANNDLAGEKDGSWKSRLEKEGIRVETVLTGLGQYVKIQELFIEHAKAAVELPENRNNINRLIPESAPVNTIDTADTKTPCKGVVL